MRVLQLIDTLEAGGAERVAVNLANTLSTKITASFLCATRKEGALKSTVKKEVKYLFLNRTSTIDVKAIRLLSTYVKYNKISLIHAHATSFFMATLIKCLNPKIKLIWHDHYGKSEFLSKRPKAVLKVCSIFFNYIFSVNNQLVNWAKLHLHTSCVSYLPNYAELDTISLQTQLEGVVDKRVVCLANLRPQKDHVTLIKAFKEVSKTYPYWSLHLVGQNFKDEYSKSIISLIKTLELGNNVFIYGSCLDISAILNSCNIGVLSSKSEGLPLALIEYALAGLPVVATDVGDCNLVISNRKYGQLIPSEAILELQNAIEFYIKYPDKAKLTAKSLQQKVKKEFSKETTIHKLMSIYQTI